MEKEEENIMKMKRRFSQRKIYRDLREIASRHECTLRLTEVLLHTEYEEIGKNEFGPLFKSHEFPDTIDFVFFNVTDAKTGKRLTYSSKKMKMLKDEIRAFLNITETKEYETYVYTSRGSNLTFNDYWYRHEHNGKSFVNK